MVYSAVTLSQRCYYVSAGGWWSANAAQRVELVCNLLSSWMRSAFALRRGRRALLGAKGKTRIGLPSLPEPYAEEG
jgi:hypothetical protein